jgi:hypothetical protein
LPPLTFENEQRIQLLIPSLPLNSGSYRIQGLLGDEHAMHLYDQRSTELYVVESDHPEFGLMWMAHEWQF